MREREQGTAQGVLLHHGAAETGGAGIEAAHGDTAAWCGSDATVGNREEVVFLKNPLRQF